MTARFLLAESDDAFLAGAARRYTHFVDIPQLPQRVWAALTSDDTLVSWSPVITAARWTSPRPFGVGTTRVVTLGRVVHLEERFYRWEEGAQLTFTVDAASIPGLTRFAEDIALQPTPGGTRLIWTFALEGNPLLRPLLTAASPVNHFVTRSIARGIRRAVPPTRQAAGR
ncbi:SRPBCC family protein [Nocardia sp. CS682]|uniref:SRPBCC family protein n=1 Tax=Nocardia sp. CS682 TaxID=1047172 RepID=UPI001074B2BD|nr:SRPBCC family protein [Nocardia sp. CS682]QBS44828.1 MxaD family protein [Nocardia sp. CS682]